MIKLRDTIFKLVLRWYKIIPAAVLVFFPHLAMPVPSQTIAQVPLALVLPVRPQVLIAIGNSESMDGTLNGAILTGSGSLSASLKTLNNSSSPVNYLVPAGFTPPLQAANSSGFAPYTVNQSGTLYDNGASRLNVAKAGISAIIQSYIQTTDFALETYNTSNTSLYSTWVYYMSVQSGNFSFTNTQTAGNQYVNNPCYGYLTGSATVLSNCTSMATLYGGSANLSANQYMQIGSSSDDSSINDVLYTSGGFPGVFTTYTGPSPATPYPPNFSLGNYNNNSVTMSYRSTSPNVGGFGTSPTNAGFVPFSPQVMYAQRGFGYGATVSSNTGNVVVPMTNLGSSPTVAAVNTAISLFTPYLKPETNNVSSTEIKASAGQAPTAGMLTKALSYLSGLSNNGSGCPPKKYVILISDGLPTLDMSGKSWPPLGSASAIGYGVTATFNANGSLRATNNQALADTITAISNLNAAGIKTFVIGLGAGVDPSINSQAAATLSAMAIAGGTVTYYPAVSPDTLVSDLNNILLAIQNGSYNLTSSAVSSSRLQAGTAAFQANFTSSTLPYLDWTGNLTATMIDPVTGMPTGSNIWSAQSLLDSLALGSGWLSGRKIATWNPALNSGAGDGTPFVWGNLSAAQQLQLQPADALGASRLQYLRGNTALEVRNGGVFRNRSHILGDIVNSQALYVGPSSGLYFSNANYLTYTSTWANRLPMVYVGANDGMLHAFNANTGVEQFAYIPNAVIKNLYNLTSTTYNQSHLYFVDGSPQTGDAQFGDGTWHTLLVSGENSGGNSVFALDVTDPDGITSEAVLASKVLWEFTDADMGLSYSEPVIAPINPGSTSLQPFAVFFGNGYNSPANKAILYAIDPQSGTVIKKIDLCAAVSGACNPALVQGLSSVAVGTQDGIQGQPITQVYAGDLQGNLWAIDVINPNPALWTPRLLFQARDTSGAVQPITTRPVVTLHPLYPRLQGLFVMFASGQFLTLSDLTNKQRQTVYGVWDKPGSNTVFNRSNLQSQTLSMVTATVSGLSQDILVNTRNAVSWAVNVGWYDDLLAGGQQVIDAPQLLNGAFIATLVTPPAAVCSTLFSSMLLELNYLTGGAFYFPQIDINGDGAITSADVYNGSYASGLSLGSGYVNGPTILGPNNSNNMVMLFTGANGGQFTVINPNNTPHIMSWWQIQ